MSIIQTASGRSISRMSGPLRAGSPFWSGQPVCLSRLSEPDCLIGHLSVDLLDAQRLWNRKIILSSVRSQTVDFGGKNRAKWRDKITLSLHGAETSACPRLPTPSLTRLWKASGLWRNNRNTAILNEQSPGFFTIYGRVPSNIPIENTDCFRTYSHSHGAKLSVPRNIWPA